MNRFFKRVVRSGISPETPLFRKDEIKIMNSLAFHSALFSIFSAIVLAFMLPQHRMFILAISGVEMIAKACVVLLHNVHRYVVAKLIYTIIPLLMTLLLTGYFGIEAEFQYLGLLVFFSLFLIFRNGTREDYILGGLYLLIGVTGTGALYAIQPTVAGLSADEIVMVRMAVFAMLGALVVIMGVILFKFNQARQRFVSANLREVSKGATILNTISENMNDGIFKSQPDEGFVYLNRAFASIFGYEDEEDVLHTFPDQLYYSIPERDALIEELRNNDSVTNRLLHYKRKDGSTFWGRLSCKRIEENGEEFLVGTVTDVTLQQQQDQLIKESERQLKEAQQIAKLGNWQLDVTSRKLTWSAECQRIHGYNPLVKSNAYDFWIDRLEAVSASRIETLIAKAIMTNDAVEFGSWYVTPDEERKFLMYISRYQRSGSGKGGVWYGTVQDQTEQKLAEMRISETQQFYESLMDELPIETVIIDENNRFEYISRNAIADDELRVWMKGKTNADYVKYRNLPSDFAERRDAKLMQAMELNRPVYWEEHMVDRHGEDTFHIRNLFPMELETGNHKRRVMVGYSFNINDIKQAQFELEEKNQELTTLNQELDRFVYSMSHDLRAPIASVIGLINLSRDTDSQEELHKLMDMKTEALERLDQYIKDVIDYSRNKRVGADMKEVHLAALLEKSMSEVRFFASDADLNLEIDVAPGIVLLSDPMRLRIVLNNLLSNAFKYRDRLKSKQWVRVHAEYDNDLLRLSVSDNGIGIKKEYLERIWEMFFRGTSEGSGSGLGLYILNESVTMLGGTVKVESTLGEGTAFYVEIPNNLGVVSSDRPSVSSSQLQD